MQEAIEDTAEANSHVVTSHLPMGASTNALTYQAPCGRGGGLLVLQHHFVMFCLSSLVMGLFSAILVSSSPPRPATCRNQVRARSDHVCQEMLDFTERE